MKRSFKPRNAVTKDISASDQSGKMSSAVYPTAYQMTISSSRQRRRTRKKFVSGSMSVGSIRMNPRTAGAKGLQTHLSQRSNQQTSPNSQQKLRNFFGQRKG